MELGKQVPIKLPFLLEGNQAAVGVNCVELASPVITPKRIERLLQGPLLGWGQCTQLLRTQLLYVRDCRPILCRTLRWRVPAGSRPDGALVTRQPIAAADPAVRCHHISIRPAPYIAAANRSLVATAASSHFVRG